MTDAAADQTIIVDRQHQVLLITLDRPDVLNAFSSEMGRQLSDALREADGDDDVRVVVVTGAGRAFCSGADFSGGAGVFGAPSDRSTFRSDPLTFHPWEVRKPTIAAINGAAIGLGLTMTLQFDLRIVADDAKLGIVQVRRGVMPDLHSHWTLPRLVGHGRATELILTGRRFTGAEAAHWGMASEAVPADQVLPRALELAHELATQTAPVSVGVSKRLLWWNPPPDADRIDDLETDLHLHLMGGPDAREGVLAWSERRDPVWAWTVSENWPDWLADDGLPRP
ncbi:MAG: enoyl-CoA hydratase-related protein [Acidimicrobiia bacterium]|nr:enoyl-CoA hydratase-related protein [Acidimicrobiia bacterium]